MISDLEHNLLNQRDKLLEEKWYTEEMFIAFRRNIQKNISPEDATKLGEKLLSLVSVKGYDNKDKTGQLSEATELIFAGANLETKDQKNGDTSLIICAKKNLYATFSLLIRAGADINAQSNYSSTATMWSARKGHLEILEDLLLLQANIDLKCQDGDTALHSAIKHNQIESVRLLLRAEVILNAQNKLSEDGLSIARSKGYNEIVDILSSALTNPTTQFPECTEETVSKELKLAKEKLSSLR